MRLDVSRQAFIEAVLHLTIAGVAASSPEIPADTPKNAVQTLV